MLRFTTPFVAVAALAVAGCGSSDDASSGGHTTGTQSTTVTSASPTGVGGAAGKTAAAGTVTIHMKNIAFDPQKVTVKVGQKVVWVNQDDVSHNVVADSGADFKSEVFGKAGSYSTTIEKAGTIKYECTLHPGMDGEITAQ